MNMIAKTAAAALVIAAFGSPGQANARSAAPAAAEWTIGPIVKGHNYSRGMPLHPTPAPRGGLAIDLPQAPGSVHYVTFRHGSLVGKTRIVMRYRIDAAPGVRIVPRTAPHMAAMITPYFQRAGDNWSGRGPFEAYRWYATFASQSPLTPGEHELVAPLNGNWTAVMTSSARSNRAAFAAALAGADQVGFVLGGGDGVGHGIFATGPARLIITDFRIE